MAESTEMNTKKQHDPFSWEPPYYGWKELVLGFIIMHSYYYTMIGFSIVGFAWWCAGRFLPHDIEVATKTLLATGMCTYIIQIFFSKASQTGNRIWPAFIRPWVRCAGYFPVVLSMWDGEKFSSIPNDGHKQVFDMERRRFVFGLHPHGPIPIAASVLLPHLSRWPGMVEKIRLGVASVVFGFPFLREFYLWFGAVHASRRTLSAQLQQNRSVVLLPGGIKEQLLVCTPEREVVVLQHRKGFVRLALLNGASLVPIFGFGERRGYKVSRVLAHISWLLKKLCNAGIPLVRGRWFSLVPFPHPVKIVVGKPIRLPRISLESESQKAPEENITNNLEKVRGDDEDMTVDSVSTPQAFSGARPSPRAVLRQEQSETGSYRSRRQRTQSNSRWTIVDQVMTRKSNTEISINREQLEQLVDHFHAIYMDELRDLYLEHRERAGYGSVELKIL